MFWKLRFVLIVMWIVLEKVWKCCRFLLILCWCVEGEVIGVWVCLGESGFGSMIFMKEVIEFW